MSFIYLFIFFYLFSPEAFSALKGIDIQTGLWEYQWLLLMQFHFSHLGCCPVLQKTIKCFFRPHGKQSCQRSPRIQSNKCCFPPQDSVATSLPHPKLYSCFCESLLFFLINWVHRGYRLRKNIPGTKGFYYFLWLHLNKHHIKEATLSEHHPWDSSWSFFSSVLPHLLPRILSFSCYLSWLSGVKCIWPGVQVEAAQDGYK